jgi:alpha,alpha-trehalase
MKKYGLIFLILINMGILSNAATPPQKRYSNKELESILTGISKIYEEISPRVIQPAEGYLKYPYLIPAGYYKQMWDWDGYFIGYYFLTHGKPEYLKYWALNLLEGVDNSGYVSGCATTKGPRVIFGKFSMKPFLSQGVLLASKACGDYEWIRPYYDKLCKVLEYRDGTQLDKKYGLYYWETGFQSGADNNVALNYFEGDKRSFLACDCCTMQLRELSAQSIIARKLGFPADAQKYEKKAAVLRAAINKYLWCDKDKMYYNVDRETGAFYKRISYSCFWPLVENLPEHQNGRQMIKRHLINPEEMKSEYGFRSLSLKDPDYNNKNIIVPFSNWQGPLWVVANFIYSIGLHEYGFDKEAGWMAGALGNVLLDDLRQFDTMHESYNADTGTGLAPAQSYVDKDGKFIGFISWNLCMQNILEGAAEGNWSIMKIQE